MKASLTLCFILGFARLFAIDLSLQIPDQLEEVSVSQLAIDDFSELLEKACHCEVKRNAERAEIVVELPKIDLSAEVDSFWPVKGDFHLLPYPETGYTWTSREENGSIKLKLETKSFEGVAMGLYGLLQEQLDFKFYHPKETFIPDLTEWPLPEQFEWTAKPRFHKRGFHLHTQHPLELTEQLHDHEFPNAIEDIKVYIDWLVRNGQNYFEFNLLESIDHEHWPAHAQQFVDYAHQRGILAGVDLSLHMIQQKAFMLYRSLPASFRSKEKQVEKWVHWLMQVDWDLWNVEFSTTEFTGGDVEMKAKLQLLLLELLKPYGTKLMGRIHVVKEETEIGGAKKHYQYSPEEAERDKSRGIMPHTVMFYTMSEEHAPVYGNENLQHIEELLIENLAVRETWYYPESAYWVTFDNSVPMTLLPYLNARLADIERCAELGTPGHLTFSSGWEWGYWLFDWSIARWSWQHTFSGGTEPVAGKAPQQNTAIEYLAEWFPEVMEIPVQAALNLQQTYLKDSNLIRYMVAQTVTDEMGPLSIQLQPVPEKKYSYYANKANAEELEKLKREGIEPLFRFHQKNQNIVKQLNELSKQLPLEPYQIAVYEELLDGIEITGLRAKHRAETLSMIYEKRKSKIDRSHESTFDQFAEKAMRTRLEALKIVRGREANYRYSLEQLTTKRVGHTSYHFGYLYPVHDLHFWLREEEQIKRNRWLAPFMNIWNVARIIGLKN